MNSILLVFPLILISSLCAMGQKNIAAAARLITNADSVILISHVATEENHDKPEGKVLPPGSVDVIKPLVFPSFFVGEDINPDIILQRKFLYKQDIVAVVNIIRKPVKCKFR